MIKFIRIGDQLEKGKDQFAFFIKDENPSYDYYLFGFSWEGSVFDSWQEFERLHHNYSWSLSDRKYTLDIFKKLMPPDMLSTDDYDPKKYTSNYDIKFEDITKPSDEIKNEVLEVDWCRKMNMSIKEATKQCDYHDKHCYINCPDFIEVEVKSKLKPSEEILNTLLNPKNNFFRDLTLFEKTVLDWLDNNFNKEGKQHE